MGKEVNMSIKVLIKRKLPKSKNREKELLRCIKDIRRLVPQQPGYISGEYLKSIDEKNEIATISTWFSVEDWQTWFETERRRNIQSSIDAIPGVTTEYSIYRYIKTV
jgi:heme-degrading monooxygenase HmoA